jgi:hypothetical protein
MIAGENEGGRSAAPKAIGSEGGDRSQTKTIMLIRMETEGWKGLHCGNEA